MLSVVVSSIQWLPVTHRIKYKYHKMTIVICRCTFHWPQFMLRQLFSSNDFGKIPPHTVLLRLLRPHALHSYLAFNIGAW